jgi:polysaccharide export outer membrane protein
MREIRSFGKAAIQKAILITLITIFGAGIAAPSFASDASYRLGAGDKIRVTVFGEADLSGQYEIDGSGVVAFPLVGEVKATGGTARDLEKGIAAKLSEGYLKNPTVSVEVLSYRPFFILGEVKRPGSYAYKNGLNVLNAVALAGGYTYRAKSSVWVLTRSGDQNFQEREITDGDFRIQPGDTIVIPERFF